MRDGTPYRPGLVEHMDATRRALLAPESSGALTPGLRAWAAARVAVITGRPDLAATYSAEAADGPATAGATGTEPPAGDPALLDAVRRFTDAVTRAPRAVSPEALGDLTAQGLGPAEIVSLAQICAFVAFEARVAAGLALLDAPPAPAAAPGTAVDPADDRPTGEQPTGEPVAEEPLTAPVFTLAQLTWQPRIPAVDAASLSAVQQAVIDAHATLSVASPYYRTLLHDPAALDHRTHVYNTVMYGRGGLPRPERELATLLVSRINGCVYCASVHGRKYAQLSRDEAAAEKVLHTGGAALAASPRPAAIARFAERHTLTPPRTDASDVAALRAAGLTEVELTDLVYSVALFAWANRLMLVLGDAEPSQRPDGDSDGPAARESCSRTSG
ncbi:peroxidase-related enzyme [Streptomyces sp. KM273126]|uniref:peroxidase-related enzyme n=1 Tax=Streptomyces sp. KM273126 TaxID=2545247 RepID=UPI00103A018B|nr:peroxidase-related enzyme [Streptomyces sp. KM273126]MBA2813099.1 peroxidase-related enzyme [Streptomyces sp. KM273126]